jgi:AraC-like DNA-binding protein
MEAGAIRTTRVDSPLGRWTHTEWYPPHLAGVVERIWYFDGALAHQRERTFPNGMLELIVHLGARYRLVNAADPGRADGPAGELCPVTSLGGIQSGPTVVEAPLVPRSTVLGVRFHPAGAYALIDRPLCEVSGLTVDLHDLMGAAAHELEDRCQDAPSGDGEACVRAAARWVSERIARSRRVDPAVAWAAEQIDYSGGAISVTRLREQTGLSKMRFVTAFREQIGVAPKLYARIVRFRRVLAMIHEKTAPLSAFALAAGYYDQAHMTGEFRALSGLTPGEFLAAARYPESVSVVEASL